MQFGEFLKNLKLEKSEAYLTKRLYGDNLMHHYES